MTSDDEPVNAPERVWLAPDLGDDWSILKVGDAIYWEGVDRHHPDDCETEYVRADIAEARIRELLAQLPEGMEHCTIEFKECEHGHGRLVATNWVDHGCHFCRIRELTAELEELRGFYSKYSMVEHKLDRGTHVIVPVDPTPEMEKAGASVCCGYTECLDVWEQMIRAAQPGASD